MAINTVVEDYILAAMARTRHAWAENGTLVLTIPEFPGMVACGADIPSAMRDLFRLLEGWIWLSHQRNFSLPAMQTDEGILDLNSTDTRALIKFHRLSEATTMERNEAFVGGPDEMDAYIDSLKLDDHRS